MEDTDIDERHPEVTYADDRVPGRMILAVLAGLVLFSTLLCIVAWRLLVARERSLQAATFTVEPPARLAVRTTLFDVSHPRPPLAARQREALDHYGWVDRPRKLVRIPVERAVDLILSRGMEKR